MRTKILDCTLRDGGYYTNWDFDDHVIQNYINYTNHLNIDFIEIGYRNLKNQHEYKGQFYYLPLKTLKYFRENSKHKIAIMIDFKSVPIDKIKELLFDCREFIDLVRIAISPLNLPNCQNYINEINKMNFKVALNIMHLSEWKLDTIKKDIIDLKSLEYLYLVDSYGAMFPDKLEEVINEIKNFTSLNLGFHSHDNIDLAFSNTLTAIKNNISIIDSTILGMGRGAGNLKTELLLLMILSRSSNHNNSKEYDSLSNLVELFMPLKQKYNWGSDMSYKFAGMNSYPQKDIMSLKITKNFKFSQIRDHFDNKVESNTQIKRVKDHFKLNDLDTIIIGGGDTIRKHRSAIFAFFNKNCKNYNFIFSSLKHSELINPDMDNLFQIIIGSDYDKIDTNITKKLYYILPNPVNINSYKALSLQNVFSLSDKNNTKETFIHLESSLTLVSKISSSKKVLMLGFDGYDNKSKFFNVFRKNEEIFKNFQGKLKIVSLTDTIYSINKDSIYSYL
jgi:4-hydroxy 2-oxovalerate aldolase